MTISQDLQERGFGRLRLCEWFVCITITLLNGQLEINNCLWGERVVFVTR
jgi:hypothetical protein